MPLRVWLSCGRKYENIYIFFFQREKHTNNNIVSPVIYIYAMHIIRIVLSHIVQRARTRCTRAPGLSRAPRRRTRLSHLCVCVEIRVRTDRPAGSSKSWTDVRFVYLRKVSILRAHLYPLRVLLFSRKMPEPKGVTAAVNRR